MSRYFACCQVSLTLIRFRRLDSARSRCKVTECACLGYVTSTEQAFFHFAPRVSPQDISWRRRRARLAYVTRARRVQSEGQRDREGVSKKKRGKPVAWSGNEFSRAGTFPSRPRGRFPSIPTPKGEQRMKINYSFVALCAERRDGTERRGGPRDVTSRDKPGSRGRVFTRTRARNRKFL